MEPMKVLIVEDNRSERNILRQIFEDLLGFSVTEAENGEAGLARVQSCDLVVTDLLMPVMGGLELIRRLRGSAATAHLPILAVSGESRLRDEALDAGASAFIEKPVRTAGLKHTVGTLLTIREE